MKKYILLFSSLLLFTLSSCIEKNDLVKQSIKANWKLSTPDELWKDKNDITILKGKGAKADIIIDPSNLKQEIDGFGGAFNEKGWEALSLLTEQKKNMVIKELFDPKEGAKFNICRVPIGSSDYALERYSHNETDNDYEMKNFSIERDKKYLLPYIRAAMNYRPDLKVWGSVWTPPSWMKTNGEFDGGEMKDDPKIYKAYALYLARFAEEYQKEGINLFAVAVQNEPRVETNYPSCLWTPKQFLTFIKDYMGPVFRERKVNAEIMLGTIQTPNYRDFPYAVLSNNEANSYISLVGFQWRGLQAVEQTYRNFPDKKIMQTETECGNNHWMPGFNPDRPPNDWIYASYTWNKIKDFFDAGVNSYLLWNIVLDEEGKSIDSYQPWPQNAAVVVDKTTKEVIYTPMFYAFKHFTYFVEPGAHYASTTHGKNYSIAFLNPDGNLVIVLENNDPETKPTSINIKDYWLKVKLPGKSWSTIVVPPLK